MKQPTLKNLKVNKKETEALRKLAKETKAIKITINIESSTLNHVKALSEESGIPYQRLINKALREKFSGVSSYEARLESLEKEVKAMKKKLAAAS